MPEKFKVVISGLSGRFPECNDVKTFKEKLYNGDEFVTIDDRRWPVGFKDKRMKKKNRKLIIIQIVIIILLMSIPTVQPVAIGENRFIQTTLMRLLINAGILPLMYVRFLLA